LGEKYDKNYKKGKRKERKERRKRLDMEETRLFLLDELKKWDNMMLGKEVKAVVNINET
jgi:hypothetical protein